MGDVDDRMLEVDELGVAIFRKLGTIVLAKERANILRLDDESGVTMVERGMDLERWCDRVMVVRTKCSTLTCKMPEDPMISDRYLWLMRSQCLSEWLYAFSSGYRLFCFYVI